MTWMNALWAVDGNPLPGEFWRLQLQASALGAQGIIGASDCKVTATATPSGVVNVGGGAVIVNGVEAANQGAYNGINVGPDPVSIAPTTGTGRSDLVCARVEDPTAYGSAWSHNPATDQLIYSRVISGVPNTTVDVPVGVSGVAFARIDIPAGTSAITNAMIKDLRYLVNPLKLRTLVVVPWGGATDSLTGGGAYRTWPTGQQWFVAVPAWAKKMRFTYIVGQIYVNPTGGSGPTAQMRMNVGGTNSQSTYLNANSGSSYRTMGIVGDIIDVSAMSGTTITVTPQAQPPTANGSFNIDSSTTLVFDYEFIETPV